MNRSKFRDCYEVLGTGPEWSWEATRLAYRRRLARCHPDRTQDLPSAERLDHLAEFRDVVAAFRHLKNYWMACGALPPPDRYLSLTGPRRVVATRSARSDMSASHKPDFRQFNRTLRRMSLAFVGVSLSAIIGLIVTTTPGSVPDRHSHTGAREGGKLSVGMPIHRVLELEGVPTRTSGSVWFYGGSGVIFERGCLVGWENRPPFPLHAEPAIYAAPPDSAALEKSCNPTAAELKCQPEAAVECVAPQPAPGSQGMR
ncbi:MAG: hypothetical protein PVG21_00625 [Gammaproteobacteria bacterium]|jgi:hypothetical protein